MRQSKKAAWIAAVCLLVAFFAGCGAEGGTNVILTTGFPSEQVLVYETQDGAYSEVITTGELALYTAVTKAKIEMVFGEDIWALSNGGYTAADDLKSVALEGLSDVKRRYLFAESKGYSLSFEEQEYLKSAAHKCYRAICEATAGGENPYTEELVYSIYTKKALGDLAYEEITKNVNMEISDDDARAVSVQWVLLPKGDYETAQEVYRKSKEGEDFFGLMIAYSTDSAENKKIRRGDTEPAVEKVIFSLERGEISEITEGEAGLYVIKCLSTMDREETEKHRKQLLMQSKDVFFDAQYTEFLSLLTVYENEQVLPAFDTKKVQPAQVDFEYYYERRK